VSLVVQRARTVALRITALTFVTVLAGASVALASCPAQSVSTPFSQWGDNSNYFLVPGGSFEGTPDQVGWSLSGATLSAGNEPFFVDGTTDGQLLTINGGGSATSPYFCADDTMGSLRFFAQQVAAGSDLQVEAVVQTPSGGETVPVADLADGSISSWAPTQPISGSGTLPSGASVMVALRFTAPSSAGSWQVDDVYVDPYRSG
jgi:hypothetical protein